MNGYLRFRDRFAEAMDDRYYPITWLDREVSAGRLLFFATDTSAIIAEIKDYPSGARAIVGVCATGDEAEIIAVLIPQAETFGKSIGCTSAFIDSREAWGRLLKNDGWTPYKSCIRKEL